MAAIFGYAFVVALAVVLPGWVVYAWWRRHDRPTGDLLIGCALALPLSAAAIVLLCVSVTGTESFPWPVVPVILVAAIGAGITGSTMNWRAERLARERDRALGIPVGRAWWPGWVVVVCAYLLVPLALIVVVIGLCLLVDHFSGGLSDEALDMWTWVAMAIGGAAVVGGMGYTVLVRPWRQRKDSERVQRAVREMGLG